MAGPGVQTCEREMGEQARGSLSHRRSNALLKFTKCWRNGSAGSCMCQSGSDLATQELTEWSSPLRQSTDWGRTARAFSHVFGLMGIPRYARW